MLTLDPNWVYGSPTDPTTLPEVVDRTNTHGRLTHIPLQARPNYYNYKHSLRIPFDKIPSTTEVIPAGEPYSRTAVPVKEPYGPNYPARYKGRPYLPSGPTGPVVDRYLPSGPTSPVVDHPTINDYRNMRATSSQMARTATVTPRTYPGVETPTVSPSKAVSPSKFGWLKAGGRLLGPLGTGATVYTLSNAVGNYLNNKTGASDYWLGDAGKGDLSELARPTTVSNQGNLYNGEITDDEFNSMSHADKLKWLADRRQYRENANYVPASPTATNEYGEGKTPTGNVVLGSDIPTDAMLPDGTMIHDGVTVAPTVPTVDNLIATANKPRVANRVANRTPVAPTTPTPTFNYGGSAPTYASSYNLNRDPNYQYSEAYAWRNNPTPTPTPWNNGWAKPNPRASSITNYYAGIGY